MDNNWLELLSGTSQLATVMETNQYTEQFGLTLSEQDAQLILDNRKAALRTQQRIEFGEGIVPKIIREFCDSPYIDQNTFAETIIRLQEIFYQYKNEMNDEITDDELLHLMREQYDELCFGDLEYLESTCLENFSQAVRAGYRGYQKTQGRGEYEQFDEVTRWDRELYTAALMDLF